MKKTLIYPYYGEYLPLFNCGSEYDVSKAVSLSGTGMEEKDAGDAVLLEPYGIMVETDFDKAVLECEALLITENIEEQKVKDKAIEAMIKAGKMGKEVVCALELDDTALSTVRNNCADFKYLPDDANVNIDIESTMLYQLETPVIFVGGLFGFAEEFEVLCKLADKLREKGLKVSGVGCSNYCGILDLHPMPNFMKPKFTDDDNDRVIKFNHYLLELEHNERPDVMLVQLPGGMIKFNDYVPNSFGILPFIISQSVHADFFVCCCVKDSFPQEFWLSISKFIENRFGFGIDCVHMSNITVFYPDTMDDRKFSTYRVPLSEVEPALYKTDADNSIPVVNAMTKGGEKLLIEQVENALL